MNLDFYLFKFINGLAGRFWPADLAGIFFAQYLGYFLIAAALLLILKQKKWQLKIYYFALVSLSVILARGIIAELIRFFYFRPRPFAALSFNPLFSHTEPEAFPSGHASFFFALALAIFFLNKKWGLRFLIAAFLIGLARIFAGVHWPSDILGGAIVGLISALIVKKLLSFKKKAPVFVDENQQAPV